jgi:poly-gamma-glutamate capsule biosynthesis protein CapA/YwtB (metallophosphatase superfamily)
VVAASIARERIRSPMRRADRHNLHVEWWDEEDRRAERTAARRQANRRAAYRRRRLVAALFVLVFLGFLLIVAGDIGGDGKFTGPLPEEAQQEAKPVDFTVEASGGILIHSPLWARAQELAGGTGYDFAPFFAELKPYLKKADLALCHLETPMTSAPPQSYPIFNTPPELATGVKQSGFDACSIAGNHWVDQGQEGIDESVKTLDKAGVIHNGANPSAAYQRKPVIINVKGVKLGFLAFTTDTNGIPLPHPWSLNMAKLPLIKDLVKRDLKAGADAVIINLHFASEILPQYQTELTAAEKKLGEDVAAIPGVAAVVGQGPHNIQRILWSGKVPIVYSDGNLVSNQSLAAGLPENTQDGMLVFIDFTSRAGKVKAKRVSYGPTWVSIPDYTVLPVGTALKKGHRTVELAGRGPKIQPIPKQLPAG